MKMFNEDNLAKNMFSIVKVCEIFTTFIVEFKRPSNIFV